MNAEILAVGTELLMGQIANTNAQYISRRLAELGIGVYYHSVVGDNPNRLKEVLNTALKRSDVVITTGGLGPTQDDLTKETIAEAMNRKLVLHEESMAKIEGFFKRMHREMVTTNSKQAYLPENSVLIPNDMGTAPGCIIEENGKIVAMLPGPPNEMQPMFDRTVFTYLLQKTHHVIVSKMLQIFGIGESALEVKLMDIVENQTNPTIAPYVKQGEVTIRVTAKAATCAEAEALINPVVIKIEERLGAMLYSKEGKSLNQTVGELLIQTKKTLALAESCTGGMLASMLTEINGISEVFNRGYVTYSNQAKIEELNVRPDTLMQYGAVSPQTALEMAEGVRKKAKTDIGIAITGIAGPGGGTLEKPVGLVYIAISANNQTEYKQLNLNGDRERIRYVTCLNALDLIRACLNNNEMNSGE